MSVDDPHMKRMPITKMRRIILITLTGAVVLFTTAVFVLVQGIFDNFGPAVQQDLEWKTQRGAREIARAADLGLAVNDAAEVAKAYGDYTQSEDIVAIVATDAEHKVVSQHGKVSESDGDIFAGPPNRVSVRSDDLISWSPAVIEGAEVGRVALVVSTRRLIESRSLLDRIRLATALAGGLSILFGALFVTYFTRQIAKRDAQLAEYALGLEKKVEARTKELDARNRGMRIVLDNVEEGLAKVGLDGKMASERSATIDRWFGAPAEGSTFAEYIGTADARAAALFDMGLEQLRDGFLPLELLLDQMPKRMQNGERVLEMSYTPIQGANEELEALLVVVSDATERLKHERLEIEQRELLAIFQRLSADRSGFLELVHEAEIIINTLSRSESDAETEKRLVHTLKGNAGIFGLQRIADTCHEVETHVAEHGGGLSEDDRRTLSDAWRGTHERIASLLGNGDRKTVEIDEKDLLQLIAVIENGASEKEITTILRSFQIEPLRVRFERFSEQARTLARRVGKPNLEVEVDAGGLRLDPTKWRPFWSAFVHAIRNAVDHGIEDPETRRAANKPELGHLVLRARQENTDLMITLEDDGRGIDWKKAKQRAQDSGIRAENTEDLKEALFKDGFSTREQATEMSGRGVGLGALRAETEALGGAMKVRSEIGRGTVFEFRFPDPSALLQRL
jgi:two-component system chemotaxis sensor kinase CheA